MSQIQALERSAPSGYHDPSLIIALAATAALVFGASVPAIATATIAEDTLVEVNEGTQKSGWAHKDHDHGKDRDKGMDRDKDDAKKDEKHDRPVKADHAKAPAAVAAPAPAPVPTSVPAGIGTPDGGSGSGAIGLLGLLVAGGLAVTGIAAMVRRRIANGA